MPAHRLTRSVRIDRCHRKPYNSSMKIAVIGDIHGFWDEHDTAFFNASDYDALLFIGDFARWSNSLPIARQLARLTKPAWAIAGNHDAVTRFQLLAEIKHWPLLRRLACVGMARRARQLAAVIAPVRLRGFAVEELAPNLGLLIARPHAMGPDYFYYRDFMRRQHGVDNFEASAERLRALVDTAPHNLIVLAHNGPAGLGDTADAPFGNDMTAAGGDFGAPDLRAAINHAHTNGHRVLAVVAGHMHQRNHATGAVRTTWAHDGKTLYINAARVPRIRRNNHRHHIALNVDDTVVTADIVFVDADGTIMQRKRIGAS